MEPGQPRYAREVRELLANFENDGQDNEEQEPEIQQPPPPRIKREIHFIFVRETDEDRQDVIDSDVSGLDTAPLQPQPGQQPVSPPDTGIVFFGLFLTLLCLFCIAAQVYQIVNPFTVTVTLQARSQRISLTGTVQLGRVLNPITVSQSTTIQATGHGHQEARSATGSLTFYNGQFQSVFVPAGTTLTGSDGVQIVTDADATVPAGNPPSYGQVTLAAHASNKGRAGNIPALDINQECCAASVLVKNTESFSGGQDARDYQFVTKGDITTAADPLKATVAQSISGAIQGQVQANERFATPSCATTTTSDHQVGQEASQVKVTVSETCDAFAYNDQVLTSSVTRLLTAQAVRKLGSGYGLLETPQITITGVAPGKHVTLSFRSISTWVYGVSAKEQRKIKASIAGKNTQRAVQLLSSLPDIAGATLAFSGFGDTSCIPKNIASIHLLIYVA